MRDRRSHTSSFSVERFDDVRPAMARYEIANLFEHALSNLDVDVAGCQEIAMIVERLLSTSQKLHEQTVLATRSQF